MAVKKKFIRLDPSWLKEPNVIKCNQNTCECEACKIYRKRNKLPKLYPVEMECLSNPFGG